MAFPSPPPVLLRCCLLPALLWFGLAAPALAEDPEIEAPRVVSALEQGLAAELGTGLGRNPELAIALYCDAGTLGSAEGYFRVGRVLRPRSRLYPQSGPGQCVFRPGRAASAIACRGRCLRPDGRCGCAGRGLRQAFLAGLEKQRFDLDGYLAGLTPVKRGIADLIRRLAPRSQVDARLAIAVALVESNLNPRRVRRRTRKA
jgi:hypothetical protein